MKELDRELDTNLIKLDVKCDINFMERNVNFVKEGMIEINVIDVNDNPPMFHDAFTQQINAGKSVSSRPKANPSSTVISVHVFISKERKSPNCLYSLQIAPNLLNCIHVNQIFRTMCLYMLNNEYYNGNMRVMTFRMLRNFINVTEPWPWPNQSYRRLVLLGVHTCSFRIRGKKENFYKIVWASCMFKWSISKVYRCHHQLKNYGWIKKNTPKNSCNTLIS